MSLALARIGIVSCLAALAATATQATRAGTVEAKLAAAATIQPKGARGGNAGRAFLNVEGKNNGKDSAYASFAVLDFQPAKPARPVAKVQRVTLTLVQSIARFSKDGSIQIYVTADANVSIEPGRSPLKFVPNRAGGLADQLQPLRALGGARFAKGKTGEAQTVTFAPTVEAEAVLRDRLNKGEMLRFVLAPGDDDVAATYFSAGHETETHRPRLTIETE